MKTKEKLKIISLCIVLLATIWIIFITYIQFSDVSTIRKQTGVFNTKFYEDYLMDQTEKISLCGTYPSPSDLQVENKYWQVLETSNGTFKMFNAYYDKRNLFKDDPIVRILTFINRVEPEVEIFCQFWYDKINATFTAEIYEYKLIWKKLWGENSAGYSPFLLSCRDPLADLGFVPASVSLVEKRCDNATNHFKVIYNLPEANHKKPFAVCVKQLDFTDDLTMQLIEWVEIISILGADKIFIYVINLHPNMISTLKYYETTGKVKIEMITEHEGFPSRNQSMLQWFQNEMISLNDCLYKHMHEYDYLVPLDIDEIIVPKHHEDKTWEDLLNRTKSRARLTRNETYSAYVAENVFFLFDNNHENETHSDVPSNMIFLQHIYRAANFSRSGVGVKSFQDTERVYSMHNHLPMQCIGNYVDNFEISQDDGQLQHYRQCKNFPKKECDELSHNPVKDFSMWNLRDKIVSNFNRTLKALDVFLIDYDQK